MLTDALNLGEATIPEGDLTQTSADNPFAQSASVVYLEEGLGQVTGSTIGSATANSAYYFELNSIVELDNTGVGSSQTSGIVRLAPTE